MDGQKQIRWPDDEIEQLAEAVIDGIDFADCYEKDGDGFKLSDAARRQIAAANEDIARVEAEADAKLAERDAKIVRLDGTMRELAASSAIRAALFRCGVNAKLMGMAIPYLVKKFSLEVSEGGTATVSGAYGRQSVESAVAQWLASEDGNAFAPKQSTVPGPFASAIRRMRSH